MATSSYTCCDCQSFVEAVTYALAQLKKSHLCLKDEQKQSIHAVYSRKDVFMILPTGFGKTICFEVLPFLFDHKLGLAVDKRSCVIVISPLIALMVEQVRSLREACVEAVIITCGSSRGRSVVDKDFIATGENLQSASIIFSSPEALAHSKWREALGDPLVSSRVCAIVVDEAHCVSKWSKEFRPSFGSLAELRALVPPGTPLMACTATASRSVKKEVMDVLEMAGCVLVTTSPDRPNIYYNVKARSDIDSDFLAIVNTLKENTIHSPRVLVYCQSLDTCADLYAHFHFELGEQSYYPPGSPQVSDNRLFGMFHASTPQHNKDVILKSLRVPDGVVRVVFATVALGMGIDLQDINEVVHYGAPGSLEDYFQESGRGGRSGAEATSTIYWKPKDCPIRKEPINLRDHELIDVRRYLENTTDCRRKILLDYFGAKYDIRANRCCNNCSGNSSK